jgi:hypothetical protein
MTSPPRTLQCIRFECNCAASVRAQKSRVGWTLLSALAKGRDITKESPERRFKVESVPLLATGQVLDH